jgi:hypothetical protein
MEILLNQNPSGWVGGFAESNAAFAYPDPNLSSLPLLKNLDNIPLLKRQQGIKWPEFSWETLKGETDPKRCFTMFAPFISRVGYTNEGRIYSIICPQQGFYIKDIGYMNVEVTVTGQRGWVNEPTKELAADMTVEGKVWFSKSAHKSSKGAKLLSIFALLGYPVPATKEKAIVVTTHLHSNPSNPVFPFRKNETTIFESPAFAKHPEAWSVGNIEVEIGTINSTGNAQVDKFNALVMELFNLISGNMLQAGNLLSWNVWFTAPELVNQQEWKNHAERWRTSIDEDLGSPDGPGTEAKFFDGTPYSPLDHVLEVMLDKIWGFIRSEN